MYVWSYMYITWCFVPHKITGTTNSRQKRRQKTILLHKTKPLTVAR